MFRKLLLIGLWVVSLSPVFGQNEVASSSSQEMRMISSSTPTSPLFAIKTNMLYDVALMPSIELEYYFARRWSVNADFQIAWWHFDKKDTYYQLWALSPELRFWLKNDASYRGHFANVYLMTGVYDLKFNEKEGYRSDNALSAGIGWGYYCPISRTLALEFALSVGYLSTKYDKYHPYAADPKHYIYDSTDRFTYIGPTKAKIGLVWRFNR